MKKRILTTSILLTGLLSATSYYYTFKISDTSLFNNSQDLSKHWTNSGWRPVLEKMN